MNRTKNVPVLEINRGSSLNRSISLASCSLPETFIHSSQRRSCSFTRLESIRRKLVCVYESDHEIDYESDYSDEKYVLWNKSDRSKQNHAKYRPREKLQIGKEKINKSNDEYTGTGLERDIKYSCTKETTSIQTLSENSNFVCVYDTDHEIKDSESRHAKQRWSLPKKSQERKLSEQRSQLTMEISMMRMSRSKHKSRLEMGTSRLNESGIKAFSDYGCCEVKEMDSNETKRIRPNERVHGYSCSGECKRTSNVNCCDSSKTRGTVWKRMSRKCKSSYESDYESACEILDDRYAYRKGNSNSSPQLEQTVAPCQAKPRSGSRVGNVSELEASDYDIEDVDVNGDMKFDESVSSMCEFCGVLFKNVEELEDHFLVHFKSMKEQNIFLNKQRSKCARYSHGRSPIYNNDQRSSSSGEKKKVKFEIGFGQDLNQTPNVTICDTIDLNICDKLEKVHVSNVTDIPGVHTTTKLKNRPLIKSRHVNDKINQENIFEQERQYACPEIMTNDCCSTVTVSDTDKTKIITISVDGKSVYFTYNVDLVESCLKNDVKVCLKHVDEQNQKSKKMTKTGDSRRSEEKHTEEHPIAECSDNIKIDGHDLECVGERENAMKMKLLTTHKNNKVSNNKPRSKTIKTELMQRQSQLLVEKCKRTEIYSDKILKNRNEKVNEINNFDTIDSVCHHYRNLYGEPEKTIPNNVTNKHYKMCEDRSHDKAGHGIKLKGWCSADKNTTQLKTKKEHDNIQVKSLPSNCNLDVTRTCRRGKKRQLSKEFVSSSSESDDESNSRNRKHFKENPDAQSVKKSGANTNICTTSSAKTNKIYRYVDSSTRIKANERDSNYIRNVSKSQAKSGHIRLREKLRKYNERREAVQNSLRKIRECVVSKESYFEKLKMEISTKHKTESAASDCLGNNKEAVDIIQERSMAEVTVNAIAHADILVSDFISERSSVVTDKEVYISKERSMTKYCQLNVDNTQGITIAKSNVKLNVAFDYMPERNLTESTAELNMDTDDEAIDATHEQNNVKSTGGLNTGVEKAVFDIICEDNTAEAVVAEIEIFDTTQECSMTDSIVEQNVYVDKQVFDSIQETESNVGANVDAHNGAYYTTHESNVKLNVDEDKKIYMQESNGTDSTVELNVNIKAFDTLQKMNRVKSTADSIVKLDKEAYDITQKRIQTEPIIELNMDDEELSDTAVECSMTESTAELNMDVKRETVDSTQNICMADSNVELNVCADKEIIDTVQKWKLSESTNKLNVDKESYNTLLKSKLTKSNIDMNVDIEVLTTAHKSDITESTVKSNVDVNNEVWDTTGDRNLTELTEELNIVVDEEAYYSIHEMNMADSNVEVTVNVYKNTVDTIKESNMADSMVKVDAYDEAFCRTQEVNMAAELDVELNVDSDKEAIESTCEMNITELDVEVNIDDEVIDRSQAMNMAELDVEGHVNTDNNAFDRKQKMNMSELYVELNVDADNYTIDRPKESSLITTTVDSILDAEKDDVDLIMKRNLSELMLEPAETDIDEEEILEGLGADIDFLLSSPDHEGLIIDDHVMYNDLLEHGSKSFLRGDEVPYLNNEENETMISKDTRNLIYSVIDSKSSSKFGECDRKEKYWRTEIELLENSDAINSCLALCESQNAGSKGKGNRICKAANDKLRGKISAKSRKAVCAKNTESQMNCEIDENQNKFSIESKQQTFNCGSLLKSALNADEKVTLQGDTYDETHSLTPSSVLQSDIDKKKKCSLVTCNKTEKCIQNEMKSQSKEAEFVCNKKSSSDNCTCGTVKKMICGNEHIHEEDKSKKMAQTEKEVQNNNTEAIDLTDTESGDTISFSSCISLLNTTEENTAIDKILLNKFYRCDECNKLFHTVGGLHLSACTRCDEKIVDVNADNDNLEQIKEYWKVNQHDKAEGIYGKNNFSEQVEPEHIDACLKFDQDIRYSAKSNKTIGGACKDKNIKHKTKKRKGTPMPAIERKRVKLLLQRINSSSVSSPLYKCKFVGSSEKPCRTVKDSVTDRKYPSVNRKHYYKSSNIGNDKNQNEVDQNKINQNNVNQSEVNQDVVKLLKMGSEKNRLKTCRKKGNTEENRMDLDNRNVENQGKINLTCTEPEDRKGNCLETLTEFEKALSIDKVTQKKKKIQKKKLTDTKKKIMYESSDDKSQLQDNRELLFKNRSVNNQSNVGSETVHPFHKSKTAQKIYNKHKRLKHGDDDLPDFSKANVNLDNLQPLSVSAKSPPTLGVNVISDIPSTDNVSTKGIKTKLTTLQRVNCVGNTPSSAKHTLKDLKKDSEALGNTSAQTLKLKDLMRSCTFGSAFSQPWNKQKTEGSTNNSQPVLPAFLDSFSGFKPISPNLNQTVTVFSGLKKVTENCVMNNCENMDTAFESSSDKIRTKGNELSNNSTCFEETFSNSSNNFAVPFKNTFSTENNVGNHAFTSVCKRFEGKLSPVQLCCSTNSDMQDYTTTKLPLTDFSSTPASKELKRNTEPSAVRTNLNISDISRCSSNIEVTDIEPIPRPRIKSLHILESPANESRVDDCAIKSNCKFNVVKLNDFFLQILSF